MVSHKVNRVIFASDASELINALDRPQVWPSFFLQVSEIKFALAGIHSSRMVYEVFDASKNAWFIVRSVTRDIRCQSYVASGAPSWLVEFFESEKALAL